MHEPSVRPASATRVHDRCQCECESARTSHRGRAEAARSRWSVFAVRRLSPRCALIRALKGTGWGGEGGGARRGARLGEPSSTRHAVGLAAPPAGALQPALPGPGARRWTHARAPARRLARRLTRQRRALHRDAELLGGLDAGRAAAAIGHHGGGRRRGIRGDVEDAHLDEIDDDEPREIVDPDGVDVGPRELLDNRVGEAQHEIDENLRDDRRHEELHARLGQEREARGARVEDEDGRRVGDLQEEARLLVLEVLDVHRREELLAERVEEGGGRGEDGGHRVRDDDEHHHGGRLGPGRRDLVVVGDRDDGKVVEEREQDDVERLKLVVVHERDDAEEGDDLHGDRDAVDDVRLEPLEDAARLHDRGEDGREARAREDDVGRRLRRVGRALDGDANLSLGERGRVVDAVAGHADDLALALQHRDDLVLVLGHDLREAVRLEDEILDGLGARGAVDRERRVREDVGAELDLARELLGDVQVVARDHLDLDIRLLDLPDGLRGVGTRRVHDGQRARVEHRAAVDRDRDRDRLVARLAEGGVGREDLLLGVLVVGDRPLLAAVVRLGLEHLGDDALGDAHLLAGGDLDDIGHRALHRRVEPIVLLQRELLLERGGGGVDVGAEAGHAPVRLEGGAVDGVVLVGRVGREGGELEDLLAGEVVEGGGGLVVDGHRRGRERARLVGAEDLHRRNLLQRGQVRDDAALLGHLLGADGEGHLHHHGERDGDRGDDERERHLEHLLERRVAEADLVDEERTDGDEGEDDEHTARHDDLALEDARVLAARLLDGLGRLADHGVQAGLGDEVLGLAGLDDRARPQLLARARLALRILARHLDGERLAGEGGLVD
mmetsp:Transcript_14065/g.37026  ORF Transcript_14065/g.37026 Transcript_14065/m.37026 type:complete len:843 (-) Transcript_14065:512-3040(-)